MGAFAFPPTRHSVIERIRHGDESARRDAFGDIVTGYWKPVYKYVRVKWHVTPEEAEDLTQAFFSDAYQRAWLEKYDPAKARFRTFVRTCVDRLVMNWRQAAARLKRGGGLETVAIDFPGAEREIAAQPSAGTPDPDAFFQQEFVRALFERAVAAVKAECERTGRERQFLLFERYDLQPDDRASYADLARELGVTTSQVTNALAAVRGRFRTHALAALEALTGTREEFRREAREILGVDVE
jgi:RNA polymerase sigma factor (sigma-70 family)